ncbi:hypothetical protein POTOM_039794 [Populus tomentosa]|uniref:Uncharacterized protein n=1 Tax=Populus tomentosa TaxID=118781 RepID=A0A8X8CBV7_POPTO|nr:hypothetical protein POTOM_039794 [Populus tomentosa]
MSVEKFRNEFDATRSIGYLCAATVQSFEQVLDEILASQKVSANLSRISFSVNSQPLSTYVLRQFHASHSGNDLAIQRDSESCGPLVNCRSSGLRVSTAAGSTAATLSASNVRKL